MGGPPVGDTWPRMNTWSVGKPQDGDALHKPTNGRKLRTRLPRVKAFLN